MNIPPMSGIAVQIAHFTYRALDDDEVRTAVTLLYAACIGWQAAGLPKEKFIEQIDPLFQAAGKHLRDINGEVMQ